LTNEKQNRLKKKKINERLMCDHKTLDKEDGVHVCQDCGLMISYIDLEQSWRKKEPIHITKHDNIYSLFKEFKLDDQPPEFIREITSWFTILTQKYKINSLKKTMFCIVVFHLQIRFPFFKKRTISQIYPQATSKDITECLSIYQKEFGKPEVYLAAKDLIPFTLEIISVKDEDNIISSSCVSLCRYCLKHDILRRSTPQNVAAAIVFYYVNSNIHELKRSKFSLLVKIPEQTISKLVGYLKDEIEKDQ
jgi:hypothetical protein